MNRTILVVDDSPSMRKIIPYLLRQAEVRFDSVLEAADGREALLLLRAHKVALILCDISMPRMSGIELLSHLRQEKTRRRGAHPHGHGRERRRSTPPGHPSRRPRLYPQALLRRPPPRQPPPPPRRIAP